MLRVIRLKKTQINKTMMPKQTEMRKVMKLLKKKLMERQPAKMSLRKMMALRQVKKPLVMMMKGNEERVALSHVTYSDDNTN